MDFIPHIDSDYASDHDDFSDSSRHARSQHWTEEEDALLRQLVSENGAHNWPFIAAHMTAREAKQCRERWLYHLSPEIRKGKLSEKEWEKVQLLQKELGNRWAEIAKHIPGRSPNQIKNHWHSHNRNAETRRRRRSAKKARREELAAIATTTTAAVSPIKAMKRARKEVSTDDYLGATEPSKKRAKVELDLEEVKETPFGSMESVSDDHEQEQDNENDAIAAGIELLLAAAHSIDLEEALKLSQRNNEEERPRMLPITVPFSMLQGTTPWAYVPLGPAAIHS